MAEEATKKERKKVEVGGKVKELLDQALGLSGEDRNNLILKIVEKQTAIDLANLVDLFQDVFGVSAAAPVAGVVMGAGPAGPSEAAQAAVKTEFDVVLTSAGQKKIQVIKVVKDITGLGLKESKDLVDAAPKAVKEKVSEADADKIKAQLEEAGASAEIK